MEFSRVDFGAMKDGGDDVTGALRKLDLNFSQLNYSLADQGEIGQRFVRLERIIGGLGDAASRNVGLGAGTVAAGDDRRFSDLADRAAQARSVADGALQRSGGVVSGSVMVGRDAVPAGKLDVRTGAGGYIFRTFNSGVIDEPIIDGVNDTNDAFGMFGVGGAVFSYLSRSGDGRLLMRMNPVMSLDSVNAANSTFRAMQFTATGFTFNGGNIQVNGSIVATGSVTPSDERLKKNIRRRDVKRGMALSLANAFSEWDLIDGGQHQAGVVAQKALDICPFWVTEVDYCATPVFVDGKTEMVASESVKRLAVDAKGMALEASMDNALSIEELRRDLKSAVARIADIESVVYERINQKQIK